MLNSYNNLYYPVIKRFILQEKFKLLATLVVSGFFLFFWVNGPIKTAVETLQLESTDSPFAIPKLVGRDKAVNISTHNTIEDVSTGGFGYGLILDRKKERPAFGLIADEKDNPALSKELAEKIHTHSKAFVRDSQNVELKSSFDMSFVLSGEEIGERQIYLESEGVVTKVRGYAGPVHIGVVLDESGEIASVHHVSSKETESYLRQIQNAGFYDQFKKLYIASGSHEVDAISGATITSEAIAHTLTQLTEKATPEPLTDYMDTGSINFFSVQAVLSKIWILHIGVIFLIFLYGFQKKWRKHKTHLIILQILSVVYIGFFLNNSFTYVSFIHPFIGTSVSSLVGLYAFFCLLGAIWDRNTYCKYVCPFGNVQRLLLRINPVKTSRIFLSNKWLNRVRGGLTIALIAGVLLGLRDWSNFEVFPDLFGVQWTSYWFFIAVAIVLINLRYPMIWCRLLCPTGSVLDLVGDLVKTRR